MNSIDYAKVLKHLLKIAGCKCFLLIPLKDKDYGIVWKMYINNGIKTRELVNNIGPIFMHSSYSESFYYELCAHMQLESGIYWPCKENQLLACIDEQWFCKDMCDALFSAAKGSKGIKIGKYSPVQFIVRNTEIEQIAIEAELANEK